MLDSEAAQYMAKLDRENEKLELKKIEHNIYSIEVSFNEGGDTKKENEVKATANVINDLTIRKSIVQFLKSQIRVSNIFFLLIAIAEVTAKSFGINNKCGTTYYLISIFLFNTILAIYKHYKEMKKYHLIKGRSDMEIAEFTENGTKFKFGTKSLRELQPGDMIRFQRKGKTDKKCRMTAPADMVMIGAECTDHDCARQPSNTCGRCYICTVNLTGEMKMRERHAPSKTAEKYTPHTLDYAGKISFNEPNEKLFSFEGELRIKRKGSNTFDDPIALNDFNFIPRGTTINNVHTVIAVVVYTGRDTKIGQNTHEYGNKKPNTDHTFDLYALILIFICILASVILAAVCCLNCERDALTNISNWGCEYGFWVKFVEWAIYLSNIIPIILIVSTGVIRTVLGMFIYKDLKLNVGYGGGFIHLNNELTDELGKITHIIFDKTGTVTKNQLSVKYLSLQENILSVDQHRTEIRNILSDKQSKNWVDVDDFFTMMLICNSITGSDSHFQGESVDEFALVQCAEEFGYKLLLKDSSKASIEKSDGTVVNFKIIRTMPFSSETKKMGIIVQQLSSSATHFLAKFYIKGAPQIIKNAVEEKKGKFSLNGADFSAKGFRTLWFACGHLTSEESTLVTEGMNTTKFRRLTVSGKDQVVYQDHMPDDLHTVGATGTLDEIQDNVKEVVESLKNAGIKTWIATGDNAKSAKFYGNVVGITKAPILSYRGNVEPRFDVIDENDKDSSIKKMKALQKESIKRKSSFNNGEINNLLISGNSLGHILDSGNPEYREELLHLLEKTECAIFASMRPIQKGQIMELMSDRNMSLKYSMSKRSRCIMAVGDGGNDVPMMKAADIAVDLIGSNEDDTVDGRKSAKNNEINISEARQASDFCVRDWKGLRHLILVHGVWNNDRVSTVMRFMIYKNIVFYFISIWFACFSTATTQSLFDDTDQLFYNILFTLFVTLAIGIFRRTYTEKELESNAGIYMEPDNKMFTNYRMLIKWAGAGLWHSLVIFFFTYGTFYHGNIWSDGYIGNIFDMGNSIYFIIVLIIHLKMVLLENWTTSMFVVPPRWPVSLPIWIASIVSVVSVILKMLFPSVLPTVDVLDWFPIETLSYTQIHILSSGWFGLYLLLTCCSALMFDYTYKIIRYLNWESQLKVNRTN